MLNYYGTMLDQDGDTFTVSVKQFTIITDGAKGRIVCWHASKKI